ncbi:MAG TPA: holo-ACP synthase [Dissulfurispiraceae bacterium]|nr:holo-ACP synthase [Dissulfurispiraceae bacterium]
MIAGIGTDIVEIERIREAAQRWGDRFVKRIYSESEISYCYSKRDPFPNLSARFAAKEAAIKALSGLIRENRIFVGDITVHNEASGRPYIVLSERVQNCLEAGLKLHLTLSHERGHAVATVLVETM